VEVLESKRLKRIRYNECEEEHRDVECRNERAPGNYEPGDEPRSGLEIFSEIHGGSRCSLGGAVERIYKTPVGSSAYESIQWKQRAFANFFNELSALKEDESQRLVVAYGAGRWKTQKGTTPAPTTRMYNGCARSFATIPVDGFRTSSTHHELGCTLQRAEVEKCQRSPEAIKKYGPLTEEQMERRAKLRGLLAWVSTTNGAKKRMESVNRASNAAINIRRCSMLDTGPAGLTRSSFAGQSLRLEVNREKLMPIAVGWSKTTGMRLRLVIHVPYTFVVYFRSIDHVRCKFAARCLVRGVAFLHGSE